MESRKVQKCHDILAGKKCGLKRKGFERTDGSGAEYI